MHPKDYKLFFIVAAMSSIAAYKTVIGVSDKNFYEVFFADAKYHTVSIFSITETALTKV